LCVPRNWDAATYDRVADPQFRWGAAVIDRLELAGDEAVLDAGCGSGRVTELLLECLPAGHVVALDGSASMLERARTRLERFDDRVTFVLADFGEPLPLEEPVDAILSTATFHWVPDHDALFRNLAAVVRPGGRMAAQCGGVGNLGAVVRRSATSAPTRSAGRSSRRPRRPNDGSSRPGSSRSAVGCTTSRPRSRTSTRSRRSCGRSLSATTSRR
jgi:trans-aconitate methyltransferase